MSHEISGFCNERFSAIEDAFRANFEDGLEIGASLGVTWRGKMVVDLWGGWANPKKTRKWKKNTLVMVNSLTKLMLLMSVFRLVDRGQSCPRLCAVPTAHRQVSMRVARMRDLQSP